MPSVKDINGKEWSFSVNVASLARVRDGLNWDLLSTVGSSDGLSKLYGDSIHLIDVLFYLCKPQDVQLEQWREAWAGDALESAYDAVCQGLIDFFPNSRRQIVSALIQGFKEMMAASQELAKERMPAIIAEAKEEAAKQMRGKPSGDAPESSESTPENTPSAS